MAEPRTVHDRPRRSSRRAAAVWSAALVFALSRVDVASAQPPVGWRMDGTGNYPRAEPPTEWSPTSHVLWSTPMPKWSNSSPILVGDRLFVSSERDTLICLGATDGQLLWRRSNPVRDTVAATILYHPVPEQESRIRQARVALSEKEYELTGIRQRLRKAPGDKGLNEKVQSLAKQITGLRSDLASLAAASNPPSVHDSNGYSTPTPTSDGVSVYALYGTGVVASYDLEGHRRWIKFVDLAQVGNGPSASPVLVGGKLLIQLEDLVALDAATGEVAWRVNVPPRNGTPIAFQIEGQDVVILPSGRCVRVADGAILASDVGDLEFNSPLVRDGVIYMIQGTAQAFRIPEKMSDSLDFKPLWTAKLKGERYYSSPLLLDGLIYAITRTQIFNVVDAKTGDIVYTERLHLGEAGGADNVYSSIAQAGRYVFVSGFEGTTAVLKPGRQLEQVAFNHLAPFRSNPVFAGDRIYVRANDRFYCLSSSAASTESH